MKKKRLDTVVPESDGALGPEGGVSNWDFDFAQADSKRSISDDDGMPKRSCELHSRAGVLTEDLLDGREVDLLGDIENTVDKNRASLDSDVLLSFTHIGPDLSCSASGTPDVRVKGAMAQAQGDAQRPSTWTKYRKGLCEGCWAGCCTLPVEASAVDLIRLGLATEEEAAISLKDLAKRLLKEKWIQSFNPKAQLFVLAQVGGRDCVYLDEQRLCKVYDRRPQVCRKFPEIGPRPGFCPAKPKRR